MAIIYSYQTNTNILATDLIIGSSTKVVNGKKKNVTKNFGIGNIAEFYNEISAIAIAGQNNFFFQNLIAPGRKPGTISFISGGGTGTLFSNITTLRISKSATSGNVVIDYINTLVDKTIIIAQCDDLNNFGTYKFNSITPVTGDPNFFDIVIESVEAHGSIQEDKFYAFAVYPGDGGGSNYIFTSPLVDTDGTVTIDQSSSISDGYLSALDWNTFNSKQEEISGIGFVKAFGTTLSYDDTSYYPYPDGSINEYIVGDGSIATFPVLTGFVPYEGATSDVLLGNFGISLTNVEFSNSPSYVPTNTVGNMYWGDTDGTVNLVLKGGNVVLQVGQEQVLRVVNKTATNINLLESNYQAVRITGAQGQRIKVDLALATSDSLSAETIGLVTETINNNQEGFVTTSGLVRGINTTGSLQGESWADGDVLYLSPTVAGRATKIKPVAPSHLVIIGYVVHAHITQGSIFVKVDNGYELEELHNVTSTNFTTPISTDSVLTYDITTSLWKRLTLANLKTYLTNIRRNSQSGNINYCGYAPAGSLESSAVWTITKITVATNGTVTTQVFNNVTWTSVPF
jgi:hypothetical protein